LLAEVRDRDGELVTLHVTYLQNGRKLSDRTPRKLLSGAVGRVGCAVRLMPCEGPVLGIAEGIETALAAHKILQIPVWAALNTSLLGAFEPPEGIERLVIAADNDRAGFTAAWKLRDRLSLPVELRVSRLADFAEDLTA
jgi:putative DNA primase/helicase